MNFENLILSFLFLLGLCSLIALTKALQLMGRIQLKKTFSRKPYFFFFYSLVMRVFPKDKWESLFYLLSFTKAFLRFLFAITLFYYLLPPVMDVFVAVIIVIATGLLSEFLTRFFVNLSPNSLLIAATPISTFFLFLFSPITFLFLKIQRVISRKKKKISETSVKDKILELVEESELSSFLDPLDRRLITSVASFRERIVREIMVPRIDIFCLSVDQTVHEAAQKFILEGYSRIPVYRDNVDSIVGVLLYKDVINYYFRCIEKKEASPLETPLEKLLKPVLYTPETKKISQLLQEIRQQQTHLAIVVDEYGGTEGIITIEDILEELVGEIADEHDIPEEEIFYIPRPEGGWIIDAKMSILDIEKELGIPIPQSPEYDTIGGFIFQCAGTIPSQGWKIHSDYFDLEILSTSERAIEKVILIPPPID